MSLTYREAFMNGIDIFADASITERTIMFQNGERDKYRVACAGTAWARRDEDYRGNMIPTIIDEHYIIYHDCTNNAAELLAILEAVRMGHHAMMCSDKKTHINIISDSRISIQGLRDWIFNWIMNTNNGVMYGSSGPVQNQRLILQIVYEIIQNGDFVRFYHIRGHQKTKNVFVFVQSFLKENGFAVEGVDPRFPEYLIRSNDRVDTLSRDMLKEPNMKATEPLYLRESLIAKKQGYIEPILDMTDFIMNLDIDKYKYLIGRK